MFCVSDASYKFDERNGYITRLAGRLSSDKSPSFSLFLAASHEELANILPILSPSIYTWAQIKFIDLENSGGDKKDTTAAGIINRRGYYHHRSGETARGISLCKPSSSQVTAIRSTGLRGANSGRVYRVGHLAKTLDGNCFLSLLQFLRTDHARNRDRIFRT